MVLLDNEEFLSQLTKMFQKGRVSGSVLMTIKQYDGRTTSTPRDKQVNETKNTNYTCIVRASSKNRKLSTIIKKDDVSKFQKAYSHLLRANLDGLKKLKKEKNKTKATQ